MAAVGWKRHSPGAAALARCHGHPQANDQFRRTDSVTIELPDHTARTGVANTDGAAQYADAKTRKKEFQKGLIAAMTNLADAVCDLTEVIKEDRKIFKVVGREAKIDYKDKGLCKGHVNVNSMSVEFEGAEGDYSVVNEPVSDFFCWTLLVPDQKHFCLFFF